VFSLYLFLATRIRSPRQARTSTRHRLSYLIIHGKAMAMAMAMAMAID
jgi:hypothetical protein